VVQSLKESDNSFHNHSVERNHELQIYSSLHENYADVKNYVKYNEYYYVLETGSWGSDYNVFYTSKLIYEFYAYCNTLKVTLANYELNIG